MSLLWLLPIALTAWLVSGGPTLPDGLRAAARDTTTAASAAPAPDLDTLLETGRPGRDTV